jgi:hypothetical protein
MDGLRARHDALMHAPSDGFGPPEIFHIRVDRTRRGRISARRAHRAHDLLRPSLPIRSRAAAKRHLMRRAIRGCQRLISSHQRRSSAAVISRHQPSSAAPSGDHRQPSSAVISRHQQQSAAIIGGRHQTLNHAPMCFISRHQPSSAVISSNQQQSPDAQPCSHVLRPLDR